jgi:hypothetical protein
MFGPVVNSALSQSGRAAIEQLGYNMLRELILEVLRKALLPTR